MIDLLVLSRYKLATFEACLRQFQLRFVTPLSWPTAPQPDNVALSRIRGQQFHLLMERHLLGLPIPSPVSDDILLQTWWRQVEQSGPLLPRGRRFVEFTLTVPLREQMLVGRFDLLIVNDAEVTIFDWKTEAHPRPAASLQTDLQTALYLFLAVEGGHVLRPDAPGIDPDQVKITYYYVQRPDQPVTLRYSSVQHADILHRLNQLSTSLSSWMQVDDAAWPLTNDLSTCARCSFQAYCARQVEPEPTDDEDELASHEPALAPTPPF